MQLASHGDRILAARRVPTLVGRPPGIAQGMRSIHTPSYARIKPPQGQAKRLLSQTRTLLSRFLTHLAAPGIGATPASSAGHSIHGGLSGRVHGIHQRLSPVARTQLARPLQGHYFPKLPSVQTYSVTNVGLGSARGFSTSRQVFQRLADNVPVTGRALSEVDLDVKHSKGRSMRASKKNNENIKYGKEMLKPTSKNVTPKTIEQVAEYDHYFAQVAPAAGTSRVNTYLLIPLAPTPTGRTPLPLNTSSHPSLLHIPSLASIHNSHELHSLRVSSLFSRLEAANVWEKGVVCSAYAQGSTLEGTCTILKVEFLGWTKAEVRGAIGESGTGWCVLEEEQVYPLPDDEESLSDTSSILSGVFEDDRDGVQAAAHPEPAVTNSFILPSLAFSSAFTGSVPSTPGVDPHYEENLSDVDSTFSGWSSDFSDARPSSRPSLVFSASAASL